MDDKRYKYFSNGIDKIVAVSHYAGKTVRGTAKCSKEDKFDLDKGIALAHARCSLKIADKRKKRAIQKIEEARIELEKATKKLNRMHQYYADSRKAYDNAEMQLKDILSEF